MRKNLCLNCEKPITESMKFCPNCGQKNKISILGIREIISDFFSNVFYLDSKFFKTIKTIFIPSRGTKNYVAGKRKSYINPSRVFFISAIVFFALVNSLLSKTDITGENKDQMARKYEKIKNYDKRQILLDTLDLSKSENIDFIRKLNSAYELQDIDTIKADRDTILARNATVFDIKKRYKIQNRDYYELSLDQLYEKYSITSLKDKFGLKLMVLANKDLEKVILYIINNFIWGILFVTLFGAIILKLLYFRHAVSYVELILLLFEFHAILLFIGSIAVLIINVGYSSNNYVENHTYLIFLFSVLYLFTALKLYFRQGLIKTFIKLFAFFIFYFMILTVFLLVIAAASMIII